MATTSVTTIGGVVVVTQVIPKGESSIPLQSSTDTPQAPPPTAKTPPPSPAKVDDMTAAFLRGQPMGLGVVQIFIGLLCILFSLTAIYSWKLIVYAPFGLAVAFVVSGSLAVAAGRRTSVSQVWASLVSHTVSAAIGLAGVTYICWLLAAGHPSDVICDPQAFSAFRNRHDAWMKCTGSMWALNVALYGLLGLLLVLLVLQVCVAITVCVFSGKAARHRSHYSPIMTEGDDHSTLLSAGASEEHCGDGEDILRTALP